MRDDFQPRQRSVAVSARIPNIASLQSDTAQALPEPADTFGQGSGIGALSRNKKLSFGKFSKYIRKPKTKKQWAILIAAMILLIGGGGMAYEMFRKKPAPAPSPSAAKEEPKPEPPKPTAEPSRLTGVLIPLDHNKRPVTGVMIENSPDARPQSGLKDAGIVFEAVAEGGITRFLALFLESQPDYIGPVRSVRPYYLDWVAPFDAGIAHVGGSPEALAQLRAGGLRDLDQFQNSGAYRRVSNRYAPHNMYTSMASLDALNQQKGFTSSTFTSFARKPDAPNPAPYARAIDITLGGFLYNVHYDYDAASNSYKRSEGGRPHLDEKSAAQLSPKVVVALVMPKGIASDGQHTTYGTNGTGPMIVFQDGARIDGTWAKADRKSQFVFTDTAGAPLKLNPGQTWFTAVPTPSAVAARP